MTSENQGGWAERPAAADSLLGLEDPGWKGSSLRWQEELQARIENSERRELARILPLVFRQSFGVRTVRICFDWVGGFPGAATLTWVLREARALADAERVELQCELCLAIEAVTPQRLEGLAALPLNVRLVARSGEGDRLQVAALDRLNRRDRIVRIVERFGERLTMQVAAPGSRLRALWEWAQKVGLRHLDLVELAPSAARNEGELRAYRQELTGICDDILAWLAEGRMPCDFVPLTRLVSRLRRSEPLGGDSVELGSPSVWLSRKESGGAGGPGLAIEGLSPLDSFEEAEIESVGDGSTCRSCWARQICGHSSFVASPLAERNGLGPSSGSCARWRIEAEAAVRFYHQLAETDPIQALRFFEELPHGAAAPLDARDGSDFSRVPF